MPRGSKVERKCANRSCGIPIFPRAADVARGWGRFCSKSCKASAQEASTHQYANHCNHKSMDEEFGHPFESGSLGHGQE